MCCGARSGVFLPAQSLGWLHVIDRFTAPPHFSASDKLILLERCWPMLRLLAWGEFAASEASQFCGEICCKFCLLVSEEEYFLSVYSAESHNGQDQGSQTFCVFFPLTGWKDNANLHVLPGLQPSLARRDAAEDDEGVGSTCLPICHVFLSPVFASATFDEWGAVRILS